MIENPVLNSVQDSGGARLLLAALTPPGFCVRCGRKLNSRWRHQGPPRNQLRGACIRCERAEGSDSTRDVSRPDSGTKPPTCVHRWLLERPKGRLVPGSCRDCGETRNFRGVGLRHGAPVRSLADERGELRAEPNSCVHRWRLESPAGDKVPGVCAYCGSARSFPSEHNWREPTPEERAQRRAIRLQFELELTDATTE